MSKKLKKKPNPKIRATGKRDKAKAPSKARAKAKKAPVRKKAVAARAPVRKKAVAARAPVRKKAVAARVPVRKKAVAARVPVRKKAVQTKAKTRKQTVQTKAKTRKKTVVAKAKVRKKPPTKAQVREKKTRIAKKGWATRRRIAREEGSYTPSRRQQIAHKKSAKKAVKHAEAILKKTFRKREQEYKERERAAKVAERKKIEKARLREQDKFKQVLAGTVDGQKMLKELIKVGAFEETNETIIIERMRAAELIGDSYDEAYRLAREFEMPIQEIYTIWLSP